MLKSVIALLPPELVASTGYLPGPVGSGLATVNAPENDPSLPTVTVLPSVTDVPPNVSVTV